MFLQKRAASLIASAPGNPAPTARGRTANRASAKIPRAVRVRRAPISVKRGVVGLRQMASARRKGAERAARLTAASTSKADKAKDQQGPGRRLGNGAGWEQLHTGNRSALSADVEIAERLGRAEPAARRRVWLVV